jgi:hypothetical protein
MLEMPNILPRMVHILRVINYGPNLADLISHNIAPQVPITSDILTFFSSSLGISDWDHFAHLEQILQQGSSAGPGEEGSSPSRSGWSSANSSMRCKYPTNKFYEVLLWSSDCHRVLSCTFSSFSRPLVALFNPC